MLPLMRQSVASKKMRLNIKFGQSNVCPDSLNKDVRTNTFYNIYVYCYIITIYMYKHQ